MAKPIGDLFAEPVAPVKPVSPSTGNPLTSVAVLVLAVVLAIAAWSKYSPHNDSKPAPDGDKQGQVDPVSATGVLFYVYDLQKPSIDQTFEVDVGRKYAESHKGLEFRAVDNTDDQNPAVSQIKAFAKSKGVDPPCVVYKTASNTLHGAIKWPKTESELAKVFK